MLALLLWSRQLIMHVGSQAGNKGSTPHEASSQVFFVKDYATAGEKNILTRWF
jgi:hypothetical protein